MVLDIDTSSPAGMSVTLENTESIIIRKADGASRADTVLQLITQALSQAGKQITELTEITVHTGPGSFTGIRIGITVARILGLMLGIPVNGKSAEYDIIPRYNRSKFDSDPV